MINIPKNTPRRKAAQSTDNRDRLVKRVLDAFASGRASVALGGGGGNGVTEEEARAIGKLFTDKDYFASLVYSVDCKFRNLVVSTTQLNAATPSRPIKTSIPSNEEPECDAWTSYTADDAAGGVEPDVFSFNGEAVTLVSDPNRPYAMYRREYPHKPKWIVADRNHRVIALLPWRAHAQTVVDELNALAAK
jgi:hypothetical protein